MTFELTDVCVHLDRGTFCMCVTVVCCLCVARIRPVFFYTAHGQTRWDTDAEEVGLLAQAARASLPFQVSSGIQHLDPTKGRGVAALPSTAPSFPALSLSLPFPFPLHSSSPPSLAFQSHPPRRTSHHRSTQQPWRLTVRRRSSAAASSTGCRRGSSKRRSTSSRAGIP